MPFISKKLVLTLFVDVIALRSQRGNFRGTSIKWEKEKRKQKTNMVNTFNTLKTNTTNMKAYEIRKF